MDKMETSVSCERCRKEYASEDDLANSFNDKKKRI